MECKRSNIPKSYHLTVEPFDHAKSRIALNNQSVSLCWVWRLTDGVRQPGWGLRGSLMFFQGRHPVFCCSTSCLCGFSPTQTSQVALRPIRISSSIRTLPAFHTQPRLIRLGNASLIGMAKRLHFRGWNVANADVRLWISAIGYQSHHSLIRWTPMSRH